MLLFLSNEKIIIDDEKYYFKEKTLSEFETLRGLIVFRNLADVLFTYIS